MWKSLLASLLLTLSQDGWSPVQQTERQEVVRNLDPLVWPVFSVALEGEKALVRFPIDPTYRYLADGGMIAEATQGDEVYTLEVTPRQGADRANGGVVWRDACGIAIHEQWIQTPNHTYHLTLVSPMERGDHFEQFVASLDIESCEK